MTDYVHEDRTWPVFVLDEITYEFMHLKDECFEVVDSEKHTRKISVTFSDHCFTRDFVEGDDRALIYPFSSRKTGCFCPHRYTHSLRLKELLKSAFEGREKVWIVEGHNLAAIPTVDHEGNRILYGIVFGLDREKKMPFDLSLRMRTAYPCDERDLVTFGTIRFSHLVTLRMKCEFPRRNLDRHRPRPRLRP